jgi:hypothetical protein
VLLMATTAPPGQPSQLQAGEYTGAAPSHVVTWQVRRVPPPSPLYIDVDDQLVCVAESVSTTEVVTINYRLLRAADGVIVRGQLTVTPTAAYTRAINAQQLAEGFLLSVSVNARFASTRGQTFVRIFLGSGAFGAGEPSFMLMADYVTTAMAPAHPNGRVLSPVEGPGWIHTLAITTPAAGADWGMTTIPGGRYRIISITGVFTTSNAVASRLVTVQLLNDTLGVAGEWSAGVTQAASTAEHYTFSDAPLSPQASGNLALMVPLPVSLRLKNPEQVQAATASIQAGDQWSALSMLVEEWLDNV